MSPLSMHRNIVNTKMENRKSRNNVEKPQNLYRSVDNSNFKQKIRNFIEKETTHRLPEVPIS